MNVHPTLYVMCHVSRIFNDTNLTENLTNWRKIFLKLNSAEFMEFVISKSEWWSWSVEGLLSMGPTLSSSHRGQTSQLKIPGWKDKSIGFTSQDNNTLSQSQNV